MGTYSTYASATTATLANLKARIDTGEPADTELLAKFPAADRETRTWLYYFLADKFDSATGKLKPEAFNAGSIRQGNVRGSAATGLEQEIKLASIGRKDILDKEITREKLANEAVTEASIAPLAITTAKIADGAVTLAKLSVDALSGELFPDGSISGAKILSDTIPEGKLKAGVLNQANFKEGCVPMSALPPAGPNMILVGGSGTDKRKLTAVTLQGMTINPDTGVVAFTGNLLNALAGCSVFYENPIAWSPFPTITLGTTLFSGLNYDTATKFLRGAASMKLGWSLKPILGGGGWSGVARVLSTEGAIEVLEAGIYTISARSYLAYSGTQVNGLYNPGVILLKITNQNGVAEWAHGVIQPITSTNGSGLSQYHSTGWLTLELMFQIPKIDTGKAMPKLELYNACIDAGIGAADTALTPVPYWWSASTHPAWLAPCGSVIIRKLAAIE